MDVYGTVRQYGFPVQVLKDYSATMNRYAFLLVEKLGKAPTEEQRADSPS